MKEEITTSRLTASLGGAASPLPAAEDEPFACPACGQMLAPTCRVCVACHQPIDRVSVKRLEVAGPAEKPAATVIAPASFSWQIFFAVLLAWLALVVTAVSLVGVTKAQFILFGAVLGSSIWVLQDAHAKSIHKPFRWAFGSVMLWIVFFPWYLSRRRSPAAPCRVEAELTPLGRFLAFALLVLLVLSLVAALTQGPAPH